MQRKVPDGGVSAEPDQSGGVSAQPDQGGGVSADPDQGGQSEQTPANTGPSMTLPAGATPAGWIETHAKPYERYIIAHSVNHLAAVANFQTNMTMASKADTELKVNWPKIISGIGKEVLGLTVSAVKSTPLGVYAAALRVVGACAEEMERAYAAVAKAREGVSLRDFIITLRSKIGKSLAKAMGHRGVSRISAKWKDTYDQMQMKDVLMGLDATKDLQGNLVVKGHSAKFLRAIKQASAAISQRTSAVTTDKFEIEMYEAWAKQAGAGGYMLWAVYDVRGWDNTGLSPDPPTLKHSNLYLTGPGSKQGSVADGLSRVMKKTGTGGYNMKIQKMLCFTAEECGVLLCEDEAYSQNQIAADGGNRRWTKGVKADFMRYITLNWGTVEKKMNGAKTVKAGMPPGSWRTKL